MVGRPEKRVLIFRRGSMGDAVVSLPALHAIAAAFPDAERRILTNKPVMETAAPLQAVIGGSALVDGFFPITTKLSRPAGILAVRREIRAWRPDLLIYLSEPSSYPRLAYEILFFLSCGIRRFIGLPLGGNLRRYDKKTDRLWEPESERLMRAVAPIAGEQPCDQYDWSLAFSADETGEADRRIGAWIGDGSFVGFSVGAKLPDKDWGDANWRAVLASIGPHRPNVGLAAFGAADEHARSQALLDTWPGPVLNLCGETSPRVGALMLGKAAFYLGHDSGPMHLAALAGTPCVAVFSARAKPGVWFPHGEGHAIFYPWRFAARVPAKPGFRNAGTSIQSVDPADVTRACLTFLDRLPAPPADEQNDGAAALGSPP